MLAAALALQVVPSGPKPHIAQQDKNNLPWHATVILLVENMTDTDRVIITRKRIDTSVLFSLSISDPTGDLNWQLLYAGFQVSGSVAR
jgi:hypothetical protein